MSKRIPVYLSENELKVFEKFLIFGYRIRLVNMTLTVVRDAFGDYCKFTSPVYNTLFRINL